MTQVKKNIMLRGCLSTSSADLQLLLLGAADAGKTTLLYRLKFGSAWDKKDLLKDLSEVEPTEKNLFHYEAFPARTAASCSYGVWDLPGRVSLRTTWPLFYRNLAVNGLLFMIRESQLLGGTSEDRREIEDLGLWLRFLLCEEELRGAPLCVLVNKISAEDDSAQSSDASSAADASSAVEELSAQPETQNIEEHSQLSAKECLEILGLVSEREDELGGKDRIKVFFLDAADVNVSRGMWPRVVDFVRRKTKTAF